MDRVFRYVSSVDPSDSMFSSLRHDEIHPVLLKLLLAKALKSAAIWPKGWRRGRVGGRRAERDERG